MSILFDNVKKLREKTGIGIVECKNALLASGNDIDEAVVYLRKNGVFNVENKLSRTAKEGLVFVLLSNDKKNGVILEINCETDFVARSSDFSNYAKRICEFFISDEFLGKSFCFDEKNIVLPHYLNDTKIDLVSNFKENIVVRRLYKIFCDDGFLFSYVHFDNQIGVILSANENNPDICLDILMQIAAMNPKYLCISDVPEDILRAEKNIFFDKFKNQYPDKDSLLIDKMVDGQINKFLKNVVLLEQSFIKDSKILVKNLIKDKIHIKTFKRFSVGD